MLTLLQQYRWALEEIQSGQFIEEVEEFKERLPESESPLALDQSRRIFYKKAVHFVKKEKKYLEDREAQLPGSDFEPRHRTAPGLRRRAVLQPWRVDG